MELPKPQQTYVLDVDHPALAESQALQQAWISYATHPKTQANLGLQNPKIGRSRNFPQSEPPDKHNAIKGSFFSLDNVHRIALGNEVQPRDSTGAALLLTTPSFDRSKTSRNPKVRQTKRHPQQDLTSSGKISSNSVTIQSLTAHTWSKNGDESTSSQ